MCRSMGLFPSAEWGKSKEDYKFGLVYCFRKRMALTLNISSVGKCHVQIWVLVLGFGTKSRNSLQTGEG